MNTSHSSSPLRWSATLLVTLAAPAAAAERLLLTEVVVTPTAGEYVEIHNPNMFAVDLSDYHLPDVATGSQDLISASAHELRGSYSRVDPSEDREVQTGSNGAGGSSETSEDLSKTWPLARDRPPA